MFKKIHSQKSHWARLILDHRKENFAKFEAGQVGPMAAILTFGRNNGEEEVASPVIKLNMLIVKRKEKVFLVNTVDVV